MVFDSRSENALIVIGSDFFDAVIGNPLPKEGRNIIRVNGEDGGFDNLAIDRLQYFTVAEYNIGGAFDLLNAPGVGQFQFIYDWTISFCKNIQNPAKIFRVDSLRDLNP